MENLHEFHARVDGFQRDSLHGTLTTKPLLAEKVAPNGSLRPFFGNTMIFDLPQDVQLQIARMQLMLHHRCAAMLAEPLSPSTLHMTLHDLLNGIDEAALAEPVRQTGVAFNMGNGSIALGFAPDTEADCAALMGMHARFQDVVALNYALTPHVTLAYYKPGTYDTDALAEALQAINTLENVHISVDAACLHYYRFTDMNTYIREE